MLLIFNGKQNIFSDFYGFYSDRYKEGGGYFYLKFLWWRIRVLSICGGQGWVKGPFRICNSA